MAADRTLVPGDLVMRRVEDDDVGLRFEGQEWAWRQVVAEASARAALLEERRRPGPFHVGVLLENTPEYFFLLTAAALSGAVIVGVNPTRRGEELATDVRHTDCQFLITDTTQSHLVDGLDVGVDRERSFIADSPDYLAAVDDLAGAPPPERLPDPEDLFLLIFTSGSTGAPKAVRMSHGRAVEDVAR